MLGEGFARSSVAAPLWKSVFSKKFISRCLKGRVRYGEELGVTLSLGDCWGSLSYRKRRSGFWKRGGSADGELKGQAAGGLQDQPWSSGRGGEVVHGDHCGNVDA